jgi:YidC/Oxa1 family membrane protein insertase
MRGRTPASIRSESKAPMNIYDLPPVAAILQAASAGVGALSSLLAPLAGASAMALAIVVVTLALRALLIPVGRSQVRAELGRRRIAPRLAELRRRWARDPERLQRETLALYAAEKVSPFAGFLPALAQAPVISLVYGLFAHPTIAGQANALLGAHLAGVPLGTSLVAAAGGANLVGLVVFGILLAIIAATAIVGRRENLRWAAAPDPAATGWQAGLGSALSWLPLLTVAFAAIVPLAATLYLAVTTVWTQVERAVLRRTITA